MKDHSKRSNRAPGPNLVGVRELKAQAARILRQVRDSGASYVLTHRGRAVGVILPLEPQVGSGPIDDSDGAAAWNDFLRAGRHLERRFRAGVSGVQLLSATRR
jgi:prevent-host-death family protein